MDALPVEEKTGLPYASTVTAKNASGATVPVMHACGHDLHMAAWLGTAMLMAQNRERWRGTLILIGQPAEEIGVGASAMLKDGLLTGSPNPDFAFAIHDDVLLAGQIGYTPGYAYVIGDASGATVPVMHACGHDLHMAAWLGTAMLMAQNRERWRGTLILIGQRVEEIGVGTSAMLKDGKLLSQITVCEAACGAARLGSLPRSSGPTSARPTSKSVAQAVHRY